MTVPIQSQIFNPITGVFGTGQMQFFGPGQSGTWTVPAGVGKVRVRLFGAGAGQSGGGGGFALKTIYDLSGVTSVAVTVGAGVNGSGGTSSFGSYVSASGGVGGNLLACQRWGFQSFSERKTSCWLTLQRLSRVDNSSCYCGCFRRLGCH